ncbi:type II secretion system minor pseudopilin GspK [Marinobacterium jannaschii]|uniref:type II secretion system minor pseudopilin GspK n=1 Tax=Marinobacterium jannaschii TaxID=64970 RepID=UPI00048A1ECF|nr:type II secretion system minor pseudopilin GspK [Marinobacterium jannaschii]
MHPERGAALLTVLLLVATISLLAVELSDKVRFSTQRTLNRVDNDQSFWYARGGEELARAQLQQALKTGSSALNTLLAEENSSFSIDQGEINYRLESLHQCFNLNHLNPQSDNAAGSDGDGDGDGDSNDISDRDDSDQARTNADNSNSNSNSDNGIGTDSSESDNQLDPEQASKSDHQLARERLSYIAAALELEPQTAELLRDRVIDWIDSNREPSGFSGAESDFYNGLELPYHSADQMLVSKAEIDNLLTDEQLPASLRDQLCVHPGSQQLRINPNQLKPGQAGLLSGLLMGKISSDEALELIEARPLEGYSDISAFFKESVLSNKKLTSRDKAIFSLDSRFFRARVKVRHYDSYFNLTTLLHWDGNQMLPLYRQYGGEF